jgi:hypothetical protein
VVVEAKEGFLQGCQEECQVCSLSGWSCFSGGDSGGSVNTPSWMFSLLIVDG